MFPKSFLFFIFIMVIDLIFKSMGDKKKIKDKKMKRAGELSKKYNNTQETVAPLKERNIEESKFQEGERTFGMKSQDEPMFPKTYDDEIQPKIGDGIENKRTKKSNKQMKEDILRGIIYSEILSEPKSLKNMRKSV